ncbi:MAG: hypothetical protein CSA65_00920 [Proteobacteria bacterium]|nr:MAG: hypothetical protein CSA65_00920 [Pseudomonadota bacterium]
MLVDKSSRLVFALLLAAALALTGGPACKNKDGKRKGKRKGSAAVKGAGAGGGKRATIAPPKTLIARFALRAPGKSVDEAIAIVRQFVPLPLSTQGLFDLLLQRAHLPRELLQALDLNGTFWLLRFDDKALKEREPMLVALPLKNKAPFVQLLHRRMIDKGADGELRIYRPKPGQVGLTETRLFIDDRWVIVPTTRQVFDTAKGYLRAALLKATPRHDAELTVLMSNLLRGVGSKLDQSLDTAMARLKTSTARAGAQSAGGRKVDKEPVMTALERTARRYYALAKSASVLRISADIDKGVVRLRLAAEDQKGGELAKLIKAQQPGAPFARGLLPRTTWALFANRGQPLVASGSSPIDVALTSIASAMSSPYKEQFTTSVAHARKPIADDVTVAAFRPPQGKGLTVSLLARVSKPEEAREAAERVADVLAKWMEAEAKKAGKPGPAAALRPVSRPFHEGKAKGRILELTLPAETMKARQSLDALLGPKLVVGWLFRDELAALVIGKGAEARMKAIAAAGARGKIAPALADSAAFKAAQQGEDLERVGQIYLSLVDLVRGLDGLGIDAVKPLVAELADKQVERAPTLSWGVDSKRQRFIFELALPAKHFLHFKGFLAALRLGPASPGRPEKQ